MNRSTDVNRSTGSPGDPRHRYRRANAAAIAIAGALLLAACGGSTDSNTLSQATEPAATPADAPNTESSEVGSDDATSTASEAGSGDATSTASEAGSGDATSTAPEAEPQAVEDRPGMLRLDGTDLTGVAFDNAAYVGQDVLLWFWAPW
ncbi:MAG: hypothetical protein GXP35_12340 [Actinobacteria bacterium]|nr:hypothetical protein [Actinomycetota bacterium]